MRARTYFRKKFTVAAFFSFVYPGPCDFPFAQAVHKGEELLKHLQQKSGDESQQQASSAASDAKITLFKNGFLLGAEDAGGEFYDLSVPKNQVCVNIVVL
jgi:hypothetical protein